MTPQPDVSLRESDDIQGNILAGFRKDHQTFLFLELPDEARGRAWVADLVPRGRAPQIASTREVAAFNHEFSKARRKRSGDDARPKAVWINLALTASGLGRLAPRLRPEWERFRAFTEGPLARAALLRDCGPSEPGRWVVGRRDQRIDALVTVAADDPNDLRREVTRMRALASRHGVELVFQQDGATLPRARGHEHFGFKDGISQPGVVGFDEADDGFKKGHPGDEMIAAGEFVLGYVRAGGRAPWPHPAWMRNGSFQVFRRLRQDVHGWWARVEEAVRELPDRGSMTEDLLAAKLVGRWRSGTPLAHAPEHDNRPARNQSSDNDFDFDDDADGERTPRFAHIRKMRPRNQAFGDDRRRVLRRGIPFGPPFDPAADHGPGGDRGLLFVAFMASIEEQFEHLQIAWANAPDFPGVVVGDRKRDGPDPVIGQDEAPLRLARDRRPDAEIEFRRFVETTGAVYAFAPSIRTLRDLGSRRLR